MGLLGVSLEQLGMLRVRQALGIGRRGSIVPGRLTVGTLSRRRTTRDLAEAQNRLLVAGQPGMVNQSPGIGIRHLAQHPQDPQVQLGAADR